MIDFIELESKIQKGNIENCYIMCGMDEELIKDNIRQITNKVINPSFSDFNYVQFDGSTAAAEDITNACETMPFMSDRKVVVVYRATFLEDNKSKKGNKEAKTEEEISEEETEDENIQIVQEEYSKSPKDNIYKVLSEYINNVPDYCVLIMYYVFNNKREKASTKLNKLSKKACVVTAGKPRRDFIEKRAKALFEEQGKNIGNVELKLFCQEIENKLNMMSSEIDKLCSYTDGRSITREDIKLLMPQETDNDIFDFVDCLGEKNIEKAIDILNELIYKGQKIPVILRMVERQFNLLFNLKLGVSRGSSKEELSAKWKLHPYICGKMIDQCRKFSTKQLKSAIEACIDAEETLKSSSVNSTIEMELLIINSIIK